MELKENHIQMSEKELTNARYLLQEILKKSYSEMIVTPDDQLYINVISTGLVQWIDGFIEQIKSGKEIANDN
jgi:hypothetical protein